jgi:hypothetical protein
MTEREKLIAQLDILQQILKLTRADPELDTLKAIQAVIEEIDAKIETLNAGGSS